MKCVIKKLITNAIVDSGAHCSIISSDILSKVSEDILQTEKVLLDASGNYMNVIGKVILPIKVNGIKVKLVEFYVVDSKRSCLLLGRNFMKTFGSVTFDFRNSRVKLGEVWCDEVKRNKKEVVRLTQKTIIPARCEKVVHVNCNKNMGLISGDFESKILGIDKLYVSRVRVTPNVDGIFYITLLNVSNQDITINARKIIGNVFPLGDVIATIDTESLLNTYDQPATNVPEFKPSQFGSSLSSVERAQIYELTQKYRDIFATAVKKPVLNKCVEHVIITTNSHPQFQKPYRIPRAYEEAVNSQVKEMLKNDIIRHSSSPWNAPVILVKKKR